MLKMYFILKRDVTLHLKIILKASENLDLQKLLTENQ